MTWSTQSIKDRCGRDNATLNRFFSLHYVLPFVLVALVVMHLIALLFIFIEGPSDPTGGL